MSKIMDAPQIVYLGSAVRKLRDPDALSMDVTAFRNGGTVNDEIAIKFVEVLVGADATPNLRWVIRRGDRLPDDPFAYIVAVVLDVRGDERRVIEGWGERSRALSFATHADAKVSLTALAARACGAAWMIEAAGVAQ